MVGVPTPGGVARPVDVAEAEPGRLGIIEEDLPPGRSIGRGGEGDGAILGPRGVEAALHDEVNTPYGQVVQSMRIEMNDGRLYTIGV